jgi:hypothetical protein
VPVAAGVCLVLATFFDGVKLHCFVAPAIGISVSLSLLFFARKEIIVDGADGSAPLT